MADAKKCDRCGQFYICNNKPAYGINYWNGFSKSANKDLCPECEESLEEWFNNGKTVVTEKNKKLF